MFKKWFICFVLLLGLFVTGCGKKNYNGSAPNYDYNESGSIDTDIYVDTSRKIYYEAYYTFYTKEIEELSKNISNKAGDLNGYTENSSTSYDQTSKECTRAHFVYRVPTSKLNDFIDYLETFEGITSSSLTSTDITSSYEANEARLETLNARLDAYNKLLKDEHLSRTEIIQIESRIDEITSELTKLNNLKEKYDGLLEYSTVTITLTNTKQTKKTSWISEYLDYLKEFVSILFNIIMYTLPFALIAGTVLFIILYTKARKNKKRVNE